ncbi:unnamed protein product [Ixodes persulcatus]
MACAISFATRNGEDVAPHRLTPGEFFPDPSWGVGSSYQLPLSRRPQPPKGIVLFCNENEDPWMSSLGAGAAAGASAAFRSCL